MFASLFDARAESFFITETVLQGMAPRAVGWRPAFSTDGLVSVSDGGFFGQYFPLREVCGISFGFLRPRDWWDIEV
jgi:hypothetical protein